MARGGWRQPKRPLVRRRSIEVAQGATRQPAGTARSAGTEAVAVAGARHPESVAHLPLHSAPRLQSQWCFSSSDGRCRVRQGLVDRLVLRAQMAAIDDECGATERQFFSDVRGTAPQLRLFDNINLLFIVITIA